MDDAFPTTPPYLPQDILPTPPASSAAPSIQHDPLPKPRSHPLRPGGPKEVELIGYLDNAIGRVQGRVQNRKDRRGKVHRDTEGGLVGYKNFGEAAYDLEGIVDIIWVSGSPNLQVPYLLGVARTIIDALPGFPPMPRPTFHLLEKVDLAFSSLLQGRDANNNDPLPGFENGRSVNTTDKVRIKSLVERTRLLVARLLSGDDDADVDMGSGENGDVEDDGDEASVEKMAEFEGFETNEDDESEERLMIGVYERTLVELGDMLSGPPIGIITDDDAEIRQFNKAREDNRQLA